MSSSGSIVLAADYNNVWNLTNTILGTGVGQYGYGQTLSSNQVNVNAQVKLLDWVNLRSDLVRIATHQLGTAPTSATLPVPGNLKPITISSATNPVLSNGLYSITFAIPIQTVAPSVGASYKITGCKNNNYNGTYVSTASTVTSVTLTYASNPGTYDPSNPVVIASVLTYDLVNKYQSYVQTLYTNAFNPTINITGTISGGTTTLATSSADILMLNGAVTGPSIPANATVTAVNPGISITLSAAAQGNQTNASFAVIVTTGVKTVANNQLSSASLTSVSRNTSWNQDISTTATFIFRDSNGNPSADVARAFFNAGSQIEIAPSLTGTFSSGSTIKDQTWATMFTQVGQIIFKANSTTQNNTSTGGSGLDNNSSSPSIPSSVGWFTLSTFPRLIFIKNAPSGAYSTNALNVYASKDSTGTQLIITVRFQDDATGNVDENVDGTLAVTFTSTYASGSNVSTPFPIASATPIQ